jgi:hypothetical protein
MIGVYLAFMNELDYFKFYKILPEKKLLCTLLQVNKSWVYPENHLKRIKIMLLPKIIKCRVLITIESYGADMKTYGNEQNIILRS